MTSIVVDALGSLDEVVFVLPLATIVKVLEAGASDRDSFVAAGASAIVARAAASSQARSSALWTTTASLRASRAEESSPRRNLVAIGTDGRVDVKLAHHPRHDVTRADRDGRVDGLSFIEVMLRSIRGSTGAPSGPSTATRDSVGAAAPVRAVAEAGLNNPSAIRHCRCGSAMAGPALRRSSWSESARRSIQRLNELLTSASTARTDTARAIAQQTLYPRFSCGALVNSSARGHDDKVARSGHLTPEFHMWPANDAGHL